MTATETPAAGERRGSTSPAAGHHDWLLEEMNRQAAAGITDVDMIGDGRMEYDGPRCADDDCDEAVDNDGELCDVCGDQPHPFRRLHGDGLWPNWCACGRIHWAAVHTDGAA